MNQPEHTGPIGDSVAFQTLCRQVAHNGGSIEAVEMMAWMIGAHPQLLAHDRVFAHVLALLKREEFEAERLHWASGWKDQVASWVKTLSLIRELEPVLRNELSLQLMFKAPRHERDHLLLRHGVTRIPIAAALFNQFEQSQDPSSIGAESRYQSLRGHIMAMYFESRWRAANGINEFLLHTGNKEFAPVPMGAGPVGLALREFSQKDYAPLLVQLPVTTCTVDYAERLADLQPDFSVLSHGKRPDAGRYFRDIQRYLKGLHGLIKAQGLTPRTRAVADATGGGGGHASRPGWIGDANGIRRQQDQDWCEDAPVVEVIRLPGGDEPDPLEEEAAGDYPGSTQDSPLELYDPLDATKVLSRMRMRRLAMELRQQEFTWSLDVASAVGRTRALEVAQQRIDAYLNGQVNNQSTGRQCAIGGLLVKAAALYGWTPEITADIAILAINELTDTTLESSAYIRQSQITLLASRPCEAHTPWTVHGFLVPAIEPRYATQLSDHIASTGRLRQTAFMLADAGGMGREMIKLADRASRLPTNQLARSRLLGVENKTARTLANDCLAVAKAPICMDSRATLKLDQLIASVRTAIAHVSGDLVPSWMITCDEKRKSEARLHYTQVRASNLTKWHAKALQFLNFEGVKVEESINQIAHLQQGWVGCRHVADLEKVHGLIDGLQDATQQNPNLERRSEIRRYHNQYTFLAWLNQALLLALRPTADGPSLNMLHELRRGLDLLHAHDATGFADKHHAYQDKARLIPVMKDGQIASEHLERHNAAVIQRLDLFTAWRELDPGAQRLFVIEDNEELKPVNPKWIREQLIQNEFPVPVNFGRALLRTEWLDQGCSGRILDSLLGHFDHGQNGFSKHSSHNPQAYLVEVEERLGAYSKHLHLKFAPSLCVPTEVREGNLGIRVQLPSVGLKASQPRQRVRPIWTNCETPPQLPDGVKQIWSEVARHAAEADREVLTSLMWTLVNSSNPHAKLLTGREITALEVPDVTSAHGLEDELLMTMQRYHLPRTQVASWLRLSLAAEIRLQSSGIALVTTRVAAINSPPDSPITAKATSRLADLATWRSALNEWIRLRAIDSKDGPRFWAIAIALSAVINGMALDPLLLARILQRLADPGPRKLQLCAGAEGHSYMEFQLPSATPGGQQLTRWFVDPVTEMLILRAPAFPDVPTLRSMSRDLNTFLRRHGVPKHRCPGGWRVVIRTARAFWSTRVPQHIVQTMQRGISTTSLETHSWQRFFGSWELISSGLGLVPLENLTMASALTLDHLVKESEGGQATDSPLSIDRQAAIAGASAISGADIDHLTHDVRSAHTWIHDAWDALAPDRDPQNVISQLEAILSAGRSNPVRVGSLKWLIRLTKTLQSEATAEDGNVLIGLRRMVSTFLPRLLAELDNRWFDTLSPQECEAILGAIAHELETNTSRPDLHRGMHLLIRFEPALANLIQGTVSQAEPGDKATDLEGGDVDDRVDARMISVDEYQRALAVLRGGIDPPLNPAERQSLEDMLDLGVWSLARPREYMELRLGDFQLNGEELAMTVSEYPGHSLKTAQAVRRIPISILAPPQVLERLSARIQSIRDQHPNPNSEEASRSLFFSPPLGTPARAHHDRLLALLRQVLRNITGDREFRVYGLRHAGANWLLMSLEGNGSALWQQVWASHPAMAQWLKDGPLLRKQLLGSDDRTDRRALLAITKIQGHLASATTYMHYLHVSCLLQLQSILQLTEELPHHVIADAAAITRSTHSEQRKMGWQHVLAKARTRTHWSTREAQVASDQSGMQTGQTYWLSYDDLDQLLSAHGTHQQPLEAIAAHFQLQVDQVVKIIEAASKLGHSVGAQSTQTEDESEDLRLEMPTIRMNDAERVQVRYLLEAFEACWRDQPKQTTYAIKLLIKRMDRHFREWRLCDREQVKQILAFFADCKIGPHELEIVLRRRQHEADLPEWVMSALGSYRASPVKVRPPDTQSSDEALERWVCFRLIDRQRQGIPNVSTRALFAASLNNRCC